MAKPGPKGLVNWDLANEILDRLSVGESLLSICKDKKMPDRSVVMRWTLSDEEFAAKYAQARESQAHSFVDQMKELAQSEPAINPASGALDSASVAHIRNQVATLQWLAMKLAPKKYGDKIQQEVSGPDGAAIPVSINIVGV